MVIILRIKRITIQNYLKKGKVLGTINWTILILMIKNKVKTNLKKAYNHDRILKDNQIKQDLI